MVIKCQKLLWRLSPYVLRACASLALERALAWTAPIRPPESRQGAAYKFDVAFDSATKHQRSLSCGPQILASETKKALDRFRDGVLYRDSARIREVVQFPLHIGVAKTINAEERPKVAVVRNVDEWFAFQEKNLDQIHIA